jgi:N-acetylglucosaminyldiphosphoundecaprenol N-acetyl-beta-D-mannosaminyltransferase
MTVCKILGVDVRCADTDRIAVELSESAAKGTRGYVCIGNVHQYVLAHDHADMRGFLAGSLFNIFDSQVINWATQLRGAGKFRILRGLDLMSLLLEHCARLGVRVGFFGGSPNTLQALADSVHARYPKLQLVFAKAPPMLAYASIGPDAATAAEIAAADVKLLLVGLGCPKQEKWMAVNAALPCLQVGVGAAFDFLAGTVKASPPWVHRAGLEWLFRLVSEPARLWRRYFVTNSLFLFYFTSETLRGSTLGR